MSQTKIMGPTYILIKDFVTPQIDREDGEDKPICWMNLTTSGDIALRIEDADVAVNIAKAATAIAEILRAHEAKLSATS